MASNELDKLRDEAEKIYKSCQHWKSCKDGSYEMALTHSGYYQVLSKIERLEGEE